MTPEAFSEAIRAELSEDFSSVTEKRRAWLNKAVKRHPRCSVFRISDDEYIVPAIQLKNRTTGIKLNKADMAYLLGGVIRHSAGTITIGRPFFVGPPFFGNTWMAMREEDVKTMTPAGLDGKG